MLLILVLPIIISLAVGISGTAAYFKWDDIVGYLQGKQIAVLGARGVGKTTLLKYIEKGMIAKHGQTIAKQEIESKHLKLGDIDIRLKKTEDVPGDTVAYGVWKKLFDESDLIFYVVRTDMLLKNDLATEKRSEDDLKQIQGWIKESKSKKQFFIIGNHWDSDPTFKNLTDETEGNYSDRFRSLPIVKQMTQLAGGNASVKFALGSLANKKYADELILSIFQQVDK